MPTAKQLLEKELPAIIEKGYTEACYYFKVVSYRKVTFKGFYSPNIYQQILSNQEILVNLGADTRRLKKILSEELEGILLSKGVFFFQAEDGIRDLIVTGVQTCALPI